MSKTITVVIPTYTLSKELEEMAIRCLISYREQADEIIVCEDGGLYSPELMKLADTYIYNNTNGGFTKNVNRGWRFSSGDYTAIVNSDTELMKGDIHDLCVPGKVTSPIIHNQYIDLLAGPFFVIPKTIKEERGLLLEEMHTYSSDSEYEKRVTDIFQRVDTVTIYHEQAQTVSAAGVEGGIQQEKDRQAYDKLVREGKAK